MNDGAGVSVVIPTWNRVDLVRAILGDVSRQTWPVERVVVVDNGSTDGSADVAEALGASVIRLRGNQGFAAAVNRGIEQCASEWVLILNNDVSFGPEWLGTLAAAAVREHAWFATGKLTVRRDPGIIDGAYDAICRGGAAWRCGSGRPDGPAWRRRGKVRLAPMAAMLARRSLFDAVGRLDEAFESYLEDVDFGLRCAARGLSGIYVPEAAAIHEGSATLGAWHKATVRRMARNQTLLIRKHFRGAPRWPIVVAHVLWALVAIRHRAGLAWMRGKWDGLFTAPAELGAWSDIRETVTASEAEILSLQSETGFDLYWKLYFALVRRPGAATSSGHGARS